MIEVALPTLYFQDWKRILIQEPFWVNLRLMCNFAKIGAIQLIVVMAFLLMVKERNV